MMEKQAVLIIRLMETPHRTTTEKLGLPKSTVWNVQKKNERCGGCKQYVTIRPGNQEDPKRTSKEVNRGQG